ncbi:MAG: hypothetical protein GEV03_07480 [Streptosporangiales bacterium]|nr:hypothetical protein [Streptosporangiales bacterium]
MVDEIPIPDATREPAAYVTALLATVGDRDPVEVYARTAEQARRLCTPLDDTGWFTPLGEGEWNAYQVVGHLFDVDVVYGFRIRLALTEDTPSYPGYNEKAFSLLARPAPAVLLDSFAALRAANLALFRSLAAEDWERRAIHGEQGSEDVRRMVSKVGGHDLAHLNQLERTVEAAVARTAG